MTTEKDEDISHDLVAMRRQKLEEMRAEGFDPFRANVERAHTSVEAQSLFQEGIEDDAQPLVKVAGRMLFRNVMGKASFARLQDSAGIIQLYFKRDVVGEDEYKAFKKLDIGDIFGAEGRLFKTRTGETTVRVEKFTLVSKSLRPLPEKWKGLKDSEQIYRQRYLDLIANPESRDRFVMRSHIISRIRRFLDAKGFLEVETPVLQGEAGGAAARPFVTHSNALDCDFFLRIALELHLKRLLVGGLDKVYEIGRVFRNEGLSRRHNPEFTMLELYEAYSDYRGMMTLIREMVQTVAREVVGSLEIEQPDGNIVNLGGEWREAKYKDLVTERTEDPGWFGRSREEKLAWCAKAGIEVNPELEDFEITGDVFEKLIEPTLIQPTFVTHLPKELCPLAKLTQDDPGTIDVFELCINGQEIAPAYSEQNDPDVQREMFERQAGEEVQKVDQDFLVALEHGMPPAGGMGVGIDRLCVLLTGAANIRETILFPSLRPQRQDIL